MIIDVKETLVQQKEEKQDDADIGTLETMRKTMESKRIIAVCFLFTLN